MHQKTILIVIDNLKKGGAEVMLVGLLPEIKKRYKIILVTLSDKCAFEKNELIYDDQYSLGFKNKFSLPSCTIKLKKIIKKHSPDLIHSHLIYSSLVARMACPTSIPLLYSVHGELSKSDFNNSKILTFLEKITIRKNHSLLAVSKVVLEDYEKTICKTRKKFVLHNYIADAFLEQQINPKTVNHFESLKLIAVGNIKAAKNYEYLLKAFNHLKDYPVTLDIYGNTDHTLYESLQSRIDQLELKVYFKGAVYNVREKMQDYDVFVMSSKNEGFGISVIEAMACGLPVILSDIPVMREITLGNALYFNPENPESLSTIIKQILEGKYDLTDLSEKGLQVSKRYSKRDYWGKLFEIYNQLIA